MICINCGKGALENRTADVPAEIRDEQFLVRMPNALTCPSCGYVTIEGEDMPEYMRLAADAYRRKHELLTSSEIRDLRRNLGMTQEEFAAHLGGVGVASIKRWELGQIQDKAMDELIRLKADLVVARKNLRDLEIGTHTPTTASISSHKAFSESGLALNPADCMQVAARNRPNQNALGNRVPLPIEGFSKLSVGTGEIEVSSILWAVQNQIGTGVGRWPR